MHMLAQGNRDIYACSLLYGQLLREEIEYLSIRKDEFDHRFPFYKKDISTPQLRRIAQASLLDRLAAPPREELAQDSEEEVITAGLCKLLLDPLIRRMNT